MKIATAAILAGGAVVAACGGGNGTEPPDRGSFQAAVTGDLTLDLGGTAVFGTEGDAFQGFGVALVSGPVGGDNSDLILIARDNTARPAAGTYEIVDATCTDCTADDFSAAYLHQVTLIDLGLYVSVSGTLTIDTSGAARVGGSFDFTATFFRKFGDVTAEDVALQGTFRAVPGTIPSPQ